MPTKHHPYKAPRAPVAVASALGTNSHPLATALANCGSGKESAARNGNGRNDNGDNEEAEAAVEAEVE